MRRDVFQAIADPTRRQILGMLATGPQNLLAVTDRFNITRTAVAKHLKILIECGVVEMKREGRNHNFSANPGKLKEVVDWVGQFKRFWNNSLDKLDNLLENDVDNEYE
jgi:DNA-binding transcriptional ArsR family regulator